MSHHLALNFLAIYIYEGAKKIMHLFYCAFYFVIMFNYFNQQADLAKFTAIIKKILEIIAIAIFPDWSHLYTEKYQVMLQDCSTLMSVAES